MVDIQKLREIHLELIKFLESKENKYDIKEYIHYVKDKYENYDLFESTKDISYIDTLARSMNRYLDEFYVDYEFQKEIEVYFDKMMDLLKG